MLYNLFENRDFVSVFAVALLAEGVDRNLIPWIKSKTTDVALLAEGVDRNTAEVSFLLGKLRSPSSRRAWIEIRLLGRFVVFEQVALLAEGVDRNPYAGEKWVVLEHVALLAEGVDRNFLGLPLVDQLAGSPSSRRAWIEIAVPGPAQVAPLVALLAEGVDRNSQ